MATQKMSEVAEPKEYTIDELAYAAGVTSRSIRLYQDRGLLRGPRLRGRVGLYGEGHLARLRLIGQRPLFRELRRSLPLDGRIVAWGADRLRIISVVHLRLG